MNILFSIGIAQGIFLILLLIGKKENHKANLILASIIFLYTLFVGQVLAINVKLYNTLPHIFGITIGLPLLFGPLHYFYVRTLLFSFKYNRFKDVFHFIPYICNWIIFSPMLLKSPAELSILIERFNTDQPAIYIHFGLWAITIHGLIYMYYSLSLINKYSLKIKNQFSSLEKINLIWLRNITICTLAVWFIVLIKNIFALFYPILIDKGEIPIGIGVSALIYVMGYLGLNQVEIFSPFRNYEENSSEDSNSNIVETEKNSKKYEKSGLSEDKAKSSLNELITLMEEEKLYRESNLTLKELARRLSISTHNLSEIINTHQNQSFFDFINKYRVEDVQEALKNSDKDRYTLLSIALEAGFNSKSSFNSIFKKHTNMTPSQYKKEISN